MSDGSLLPGIGGNGQEKVEQFASEDEDERRGAGSYRSGEAAAGYRDL